MSIEKKVMNLMSQLQTDSQDLYLLVSQLRRNYNSEEDLDELMNNIKKIKEDIVVSYTKLYKEIV